MNCQTFLFLSASFFFITLPLSAQLPSTRNLPPPANENVDVFQGGALPPLRNWTLPANQEWTKVNGDVFQGSALTFGQKFLLVQRRQGRVLVDWKKINKPKDNLLLSQVCKAYNVPIDDNKVLQQILVKQKNAEILIPYYNFIYSDLDGVVKTVPVLVLSPDSYAIIKPSFTKFKSSTEGRLQEAQLQMQVLSRFFSAPY